MVTLVSAPGLAVFLVARSSFFTWATASTKPLNKRAPNRIRFISDVVPFLEGVYNGRRGRSRRVYKWKRRPPVARLIQEAGIKAHKATAAPIPMRDGEYTD